MNELVQWLDYGGVMLIPIAIASMVGVALFIARWLAHRRDRVVPEPLRRQVLQAVEDGQFDRALEQSRQDGSTLGMVFVEGLRFRSADRSQIRAAMEDVGRRQMNRLERYVGAVGAMASVTPLMGLLGTVLGMIKVFQGVVQEAGADGLVDATALAGGIWEALVTTAAGLAVAIPLYLGYRYLLGRLDGLAVDLEEAASELLDRLAPPPHSEPDQSAGDTDGTTRPLGVGADRAESAAETAAAGSS